MGDGYLGYLIYLTLIILSVSPNTYYYESLPTLHSLVRQLLRDNGFWVAKSSQDGAVRSYGVFYSWAQERYVHC